MTRYKLDKWTLQYVPIIKGEGLSTYVNLRQFYYLDTLINIELEKEVFKVKRSASECIDHIYIGNSLEKALIYFLREISKLTHERITFIDDNKSITSSLSIEEIAYLIIKGKHIIRDEMTDNIRVVSLFRPGPESFKLQRFATLVDNFKLFKCNYSDCIAECLQIHESFIRFLTNEKQCKSCKYYHGNHYNNTYLHCAINPDGHNVNLCKDWEST